MTNGLSDFMTWTTKSDKVKLAAEAAASGLLGNEDGSEMFPDPPERPMVPEASPARETPVILTAYLPRETTVGVPVQATGHVATGQNFVSQYLLGGGAQPKPLPAPM